MDHIIDRPRCRNGHKYTNIACLGKITSILGKT